jgi:hypothetical protein
VILPHVDLSVYKYIAAIWFEAVIIHHCIDCLAVWGGLVGRQKEFQLIATAGDKAKSCVFSSFEGLGFFWSMVISQISISSIPFLDHIEDEEW